ncbi:MAG: DNA (cytosine-5-)-methyltransferase, partial [Planctomycetota bacterium]
MPRTADTQTLRKRFAEFFAGVGLVRMALEDEGWSCRFANDIDPAKRTLYESHFGDTPSHFELADVASLRGGDVPDVELATASFPCTDLSLAGRRDGLDGPQSSAFWEFLRIIDEMGTRGPDRLLLENVPALLRSQGGADITKLVGALNDLGYLVDAMVMDARWFVPQSRPRLIIVGERHAERTSSPATATRLRPARLHDAMHANASLGWSVADMPEPPERSELTLSRLVSRSERSDRRIDWWSDDRRDYLRSQLSRAHGAYADERVAKRAWTYATAFRRMREDPEDGLVKSRAELRSDGIA